MGIQLGFRFDAPEDRAVVYLIGEGVPQAFWLTRRQCAALIAACRSYRGDDAEAPKSPSRSPSAAKTPPQVAPRLAALAVRRVPSGLRVTFRARGRDPVPILLQFVDLQTVDRTLIRLAAKAGWDLEPAIVREQANAVLRRASRH